MPRLIRTSLPWAYIRGIFIQLGARARRQQQKKVKDLTDEIAKLEGENKKRFSQSVSLTLLQLRGSLRLLLLEDFEKHSKRMRMNYYSQGNKAGKSLANKLKGRRIKTRIPYILHPLHKTKMYHPQVVVDSFSHYYGAFYNLKEDGNTHQPTTSLINKFLSKVSLPQPKDY